MERDFLPPRSAALGSLRRLVRWTEERLAKASDYSTRSISRFENGETQLTDEKLRRLAACMGFGPADVDLMVTVSERLGRTLRDSNHPLAPTPEERQLIDHHSLRVSLSFCGKLADQISAEFSCFLEEHARSEASELAEGLAALPFEERKRRIEEEVEYRSWAMVPELCDISERAATSNIAAAEEWSTLASLAADTALVPTSWRSRLQAYAHAFKANVLRVQNRLGEAEKHIELAWRSWAVDAAGGLPLYEWVLLDLEASLRREQRRWDEAFRLHERSLETASGEAAGRIGLKLAAALKVFGEPERALAALENVRTRIDSGSDNRLRWALAFNTSATLLDLNRVEEAHCYLQEARTFTEKAQGSLNLLRTEWLEGKVQVARGHRALARLVLSGVRERFSSLGLFLDAALAGLDEATLLLEDGSFCEARFLASELLFVFQTGALQREQATALEVFLKAALQEKASVALARETIASMSGVSLLKANVLSA